MTIRLLVPLVVLIAVATAPQSVRYEQPRATFAGGAAEWRRMTLVDANGRIPPRALMAAKAHVQRMRVRAQQEREAEMFVSRAELSRGGWRWLGPGNVGGRVRALVIHPTTPSTMFTGGVAGGIWRTDDGGTRWRPVDDFMGNLAVSSLAIHPLTLNVMYAGTGEGYFNGDAVRGDGIFKSTDGGVTWAQLPATAGTLGPFAFVDRIAISPDGRIVLAAAGNGIWRSVDAGGTWTRAASDFYKPFDVEFHPTDSTRAIAAGRGVVAQYSRDGGATWSRATGIPLNSYRHEVAYARSQPSVVYVLTEEGGGAVYRSTDGGASYTQVYGGGLVPYQGWYNLALWVNPRNSNHLIAGGIDLFESVDGGVSWFVRGSGIHVDQHVIVEHPQFDNSSNRTVFVGNDGGVYRVTIAAGGGHFDSRSLSNGLGITQFYGAAGNATTGEIIGGTQDNGTLLYRPRSGFNAWWRVAGGDGGFSAMDPTDPTYMYGEYIRLEIYRSTNGGVPENIYYGISDASTGNANFIAPFILDPNNPNRMLAGGRRLWRSEDVKAATPTWSILKPAVDLNDASLNISAIAVAQGDSSLIWVGHNRGRVYKTTNGTSATPTWTQMAADDEVFVTRITIDPTNHNIVYRARGGFGGANIQRTLDGGGTWVDATGTGVTGLPDAPVRDVEIDPFDPSIIYAGTEVGIFVSRDRGETWSLPHDGPANVSVDELFVMGSTLVAVTHGRGLFALDLGLDGTPQVTPSPTRLDFPAQTIDTTSAPRPLTFTNTGTASVTIERFDRSGVNPGDFPVDLRACEGVTLSPGASCTIQVRFQPGSFHPPGTRTAALLISSTAPGSPHEVPLSGIAQASQPPLLPSPWASRDIGDVGVRGSASYANGTFTAEGSGARVYSTADGFHFVYRTLAGNGEIVARVVTIEATDTWAKMGVMIRGALTASSAHGFMIVSSGNGVAFQRRRADGGLTAHTSGGAGTPPRWVRLRRSGNTITAAVSATGTSWTTVAQDTIALPSTAYVGLVAHSHDNTQLARATFDNVTVAETPTTSLPSPWATRDIGAVGVVGRASYSNGTFTVSGSGERVWSTADGFRFVYRTLAGNGEVVARVATIQATDSWAKMGVMIRGALTASSAHGFMIVSSGSGLAFQRRRVNGGTSAHTSGGAGTAPRWVRLRRSGNVLSAAVSTDGSSWRTVGQDTISLPSTAYVGLVAHSHDNTRLATATFTNVTVRTLTTAALSTVLLRSVWPPGVW